MARDGRNGEESVGRRGVRDVNVLLIVRRLIGVMGWRKSTLWMRVSVLLFALFVTQLRAKVRR